MHDTATDAATGHALTGVLVVHQLTADIRADARTDEHGRFAIKPLEQHHWGFQVGVALNHRVPHPITAAATDLHASHPGYRPHCRRIEPGDHPDTSSGLTVRLTPLAHPRAAPSTAPHGTDTPDARETG